MPNSRKSDFSPDGSGSFPRSLRNTDRAPGGTVSGGAYRERKDYGGVVMDKRRNTTVRALAGFATLVGMNATLLWLAVRTLRSIGALSWSVGVGDAVALAVLWTVWRSLDSYIFSRANQ